MPTLFLIAALLSARALTIGSPSVQAPYRSDPQAHVVEEIIARVNGSIITRGDLERKREQKRGELEQQGLFGAALDDASAHATADLLSDTISQLLLVARARELNINVDAEVTKHLAEFQRTSGLVDPEAFHDWVRINSGRSFEDVRDDYRNFLLSQRVMGEEVYRGIAIPTAEMRQYYELHKAEFVRKEAVSLREIQIAFRPSEAAAAEKKAGVLRDRLRAGERFSDLARQYSDNDIAARNDGLLGTFLRGELSRPIEDAVFPQSRGFITEPIRARDAFEILRVEERTKDGQATFDEARDEINNRMLESLAGPKLGAYLGGLRRNAFLQIKAGYVDSGAVPDKDTAWKDPSTLRPETIEKEAVTNKRRNRFVPW